MAGNGWHPDPAERRRASVGREPLEGNMESDSVLRRWPTGRQLSFGWMADHNMSTGLLRVVESLHEPLSTEEPYGRKVQVR